jgi:hypothetical protein
MKRILFIFPSLFIFLNSNAQTTWSNYDYVSGYSRFLNKTDTIHLNKGDLEIRLWFNNGGNRINIVSFISLTKQNGKWNASYYAFTSSPLKRNDIILVEKKEVVKLNYDSLYNQLLQDSLLTLNSDLINEVMDKKGQHRWTWTDAGPTNYTIQMLTNEKRQTVNFKCPKYFYYEAKMDEFKFPLKIISSILKLIGLEPC